MYFESLFIPLLRYKEQKLEQNKTDDQPYCTGDHTTTSTITLCTSAMFESKEIQMEKKVPGKGL